MKMIKILKTAAGHICIICSIALLVIQILDWFNPFMDFMGHSMQLLYVLCISAAYLGICEVYVKRPNNMRKTRREKTGR
ncbi:MAG: hypothetical protein ACOX8E_11170 [Ruminococcus sp.]